jgi:hypothetical protein
VDIFNLPNSTSRTMALGSTQPLAEMTTKNHPEGRRKGGRRVRLTNLPPFVSRLSRENVGASTSHNRMGYEDSFITSHIVFKSHVKSSQAYF